MPYMMLIHVVLPKPTSEAMTREPQPILRKLPPAQHPPQPDSFNLDSHIRATPLSSQSRVCGQSLDFAARHRKRQSITNSCKGDRFGPTLGGGDPTDLAGSWGSPMRPFYVLTSCTSMVSTRPASYFEGVTSLETQVPGRATRRILVSEPPVCKTAVGLTHSRASRRGQDKCLCYLESATHVIHVAMLV